MAESDFVKDELVWAKRKGWPPWPARVVDIVQGPEGGRARGERFVVELCGYDEAEEQTCCAAELYTWDAMKPRKRLNDRNNYKYSEAERKLYARAVKEAEFMKVEDSRCDVCGRNGEDASVLLCDGCDKAFHIWCLDPPLVEVRAFHAHTSALSRAHMPAAS